MSHLRECAGPRPVPVVIAGAALDRAIRVLDLCRITYRVVPSVNGQPLIAMRPVR